MIDPVFTMLWLASLVIVGAGALRFAFRLVLGGWLMLEDPRAQPSRRAHGAPPPRRPRRPTAEIIPLRPRAHRGATEARLSRSV